MALSVKELERDPVMPFVIGFELTLLSIQRTRETSPVTPTILTAVKSQSHGDVMCRNVFFMIKKTLVLYFQPAKMYQAVCSAALIYLSIFRRVCRVAKSDCWLRQVCPFVFSSVRIEHLGFYWTNFHEI